MFPVVNFKCYRDAILMCDFKNIELHDDLSDTFLRMLVH